MSIQLNDISYKPISLVRGETREWLMQISSPSQAIDELIAKISVLEEELEISREQVQTLKDELSAEQQKVERYQEELEACQSEMEALNFELHSHYQSNESQRAGVKLLRDTVSKAEILLRQVAG